MIEYYSNISFYIYIYVKLDSFETVRAILIVINRIMLLLNVRTRGP